MSTSDRPRKQWYKHWDKAKPLLSRLPRLGLAVVASLVLAAGSIVGYDAANSAHTAHATQIQFCAQTGSGYCLNDWNNGGLGNQIKMYSGGASNEGFVVTTANMCNSTSTVTATCPFTHANLNNEYLGKKVVVIEYLSNGLCVGSGSLYPSGSLQYCSGPNRGDGVVMVQIGNAYVNRYWSDRDNNPEMMCSGGYSGGPVYLNSILSSDQSCYWTP
jgi:hypothetical protein